MYKDILVVLGSEGAAASYGLTFADSFEANVTAVWASGDAAFEAVAEAQTRYDLIVESENAAQETAKHMLQEFVEEARHFRVEAHILPVLSFERRPRNLRHFARAFDLVIVEQPRPEQHVFAGGVIGSLVSESGRPVLAIPYIQKNPASFNNVVVAWNGSASAARALGDALPILRRAISVEVVTVANGGIDHELPGCAEVARHLARHGIYATAREVPGGDDSAEMLLSYVADTGADLIIAGGYGHPRLAETILGGTTRTFLQSMTIPILMSH